MDVLKRLLPRPLTRAIAISRILLLIFIISGLIDLSYGFPLTNSLKNYKFEFRALISNHPTPFENRFSRSKTVNELEDESHEDSNDFLKHYSNDSFAYSSLSSVLIIRTGLSHKIFAFSIFLINQQIRI